MAIFWVSFMTGFRGWSKADILTTGAAGALPLPPKIMQPAYKLLAQGGMAVGPAQARMNAEIPEVDALALEWLDDPLVQP
jgi:hypothetical protein